MTRFPVSLPFGFAVDIWDLMLAVAFFDVGFEDVFKIVFDVCEAFVEAVFETDTGFDIGLFTDVLVFAFGAEFLLSPVFFTVLNSLNMILFFYSN